MDCRAEVVRTRTAEALVRVAKVKCSECGGCGMLSRDKENREEFWVGNGIGASAGDEVILSLPSARLYLSFVIVFGLPALAILASYFVGWGLSLLLSDGGIPAVGIVAAVLGGLAAFWAGVRLAHRIGLTPFIREVV